MASLSTKGQSSATPGKRHRHRRSGAISGDYEVLGLGVLSPENPRSDDVSKTSLTGAGTGKEYSKTPPSDKAGDIPDYLDKHFQFNNDSDFSNKPLSSEFTFPSNSTTLSNKFPREQIDEGSNMKQNGYTSSGLSSPLYISHKKSASTSTGPRTKFFLTEDTCFNEDDVPNAVIDLDEVSNSNTPKEENRPNFHKRTKLSPLDYLNNDAFMLLFKDNSPFLVNTKPLLQQPIQEHSGDVFDESDEETVQNDKKKVDNENCESYSSPQLILDNLYTDSAINSSSSSLHSNKLVDRVSINLSNNTSTKVTTTRKPISKANRYQSIYDQSYRISSALKNSSTESLALKVPNNRIQSPCPKDIGKGLGHSSSLPILKSSSASRTNSKYSTIERTNVHDYQNPASSWLTSANTYCNDDRVTTSEPNNHNHNHINAPNYSTDGLCNSPSSNFSAQSYTVLSLKGGSHSTDNLSADILNKDSDLSKKVNNLPKKSSGDRHVDECFIQSDKTKKYEFVYDPKPTRCGESRNTSSASSVASCNKSWRKSPIPSIALNSNKPYSAFPKYQGNTPNATKADKEASSAGKRSPDSRDTQRGIYSDKIYGTHSANVSSARNLNKKNKSLESRGSNKGSLTNNASDKNPKKVYRKFSNWFKKK